MILRRVITHVRNQEWTAIAIDFVIVVLGVFVGIQVANFNDARKERAETAALLVRLEQDFQEIAPRVEQVAVDLDTNQKNISVVLEALRSEPELPDEDGFRSALNSVFYLPALPPLTPTYQEMVSSGGLSQVPDLKLRSALSRYAQNAGQFETFYANALDKLSVTTGGPPLLSAIRFRTDNNDDFASVDWAELKRAEPQLQAIRTYQANLARVARNQDEDVKEILGLLDEQGS